MADEKVLFADTELTIHGAFGNSGSIQSNILLPGQFVALADLPEYQREAATQGKIIGGRVLPRSEAAIISREAGIPQRQEEVETSVPEPVELVEEQPTVADSKDAK